MTEAEWLTCADPAPMVEFLRGKASDRKLRLFGVVCCRQVWATITDERSQNAVRIAERHADGLADDHELTAASEVACTAWEPDEFTNAPLEGIGYSAAYVAASVAGSFFQFSAPNGNGWQWVRRWVEQLLWMGGRINPTGVLDVGQERSFRQGI